MRSNIRYILITATRDRLFFGLCAGIVLAGLVARTLGSTALLEPQQMALTVAAGSIRMMVMVGLMIFACFHVRQAFSTREIDVLLSRPISRTQLVLSYWSGFALVALLLSVPAVLMMWVLGPMSHQGLVAWSASLLLEGWLVVALALFASFTLKSAVSSLLLSLGFYVLSRMVGFFVATAKSGMLFGDAALNGLFRTIMNGVSVGVPRLDFFGQSDWLIYGADMAKDVQWFVLQAAVFVPLLVLATMIDFKRRQF